LALCQAGALWKVPAADAQPAVKALTMAEIWIRMSATVELSLLGLSAAAAGGVALATGDYVFSSIFRTMSLVALSHVFR
jgi:hypothetical protein